MPYTSEGLIHSKGLESDASKKDLGQGSQEPLTLRTLLGILLTRCYHLPRVSTRLGRSMLQPGGCLHPGLLSSA